MLRDEVKFKCGSQPPSLSFCAEKSSHHTVALSAKRTKKLLGHVPEVLVRVEEWSAHPIVLQQPSTLGLELPFARRILVTMIVERS